MLFLVYCVQHIDRSEQHDRIISVWIGRNGSLEHAIGLLHEDVKSYLSEEQDVWKECGWNSIIYLAAMSAIAPALYCPQNQDFLYGQWYT